MLMPGGARTTFSRRVVVATSAAILALLPAACGSPEPTPVETDTSRPSKAPTASATPTPSASPSPTATGVEEQLHAATVAFYAAVTEAYKTLDPAPIQAVIVPGSRAGGFYLNDIATVKSKAHHFSDVPEYKITDFKLDQEDADPTNQIVTFTLTADYSAEVDDAGKSIEEFPAGSANGRIEFMKKGEKWLVLSQRFDE